ncbi:MAG: hypothetical protein KAH22_00295 [Thiotrichaceae bacterium]|nr:hypothetical protein [Thiotrichaceae bacterium]
MKKLLAVALLLNILFLSGCFSSSAENSATEDNTRQQSSTTPKPSQNQWKNLIKTHSKGVVSKDSQIVINFNQPMINSDLVGKSAETVFSIEPKVKGKATFVSTQQIVFAPEQLLLSGARYTIHLKDDAALIPTIDTTHQFMIQTIPMEYQITINKIKVNGQNNSLMTLSGTAIFSDIIKIDQIKKIVTASLQDKKLAVNWSGGSAQSKFTFTIENIKRDSFSTDLRLMWNGESIGIKSKGSREITIPSSNVLKVLNAKLIRSDKSKAYIQVTLSDIQNSRQQLDGLVRLEQIPDKNNKTAKKVKLKYTIDGNIIKVYPLKVIKGKFNLAIDATLKSKSGNKLGKVFNQTITIKDQKPSVRFVGKGQILPNNDTLTVPFEAVHVNAVTVTAFLIKDENMAQFFQNNQLAGNSELERVGRYLWHKKIPLNPANPAQANRYNLDVSELVKSHPSGLFRLSLSIDRRFSTYECKDETPTKARDKKLKNNEDLHTSELSGWDGIESYYDDGNQNSGKWADRLKPCSDAYFNYDSNPVTDHKNVIASNIGLLAKQDGHGKMLVVATDLATTEPLANTLLSIYNFQNDLLATSVTDKEGIAHIKLNKTPFLLTAKKGDDKAYLKLNTATAQSISHFDVGGDKSKKGVKGYIYGERGVWRPGDDIHLTLVVYDKGKTIPANHPVTMRLIDPSGVVSQTLINTSPVSNFYQFKLKTDEDATTGKWLVKAQLGGNEFTKMLNIEMIRPNRLKIDLDFATKALHGYKTLPTGKLFSQWLHGAKANGLKTKVSVRFREKRTKFTSFTDYQFDDPSRSLDSAETTLLEGRLDEEGNLSFDKQFNPKSQSPGMLSAWFTSRVFEQGGGFSTSKHFLDYHPYENYVGIKLPKGDASRNMLLTDEDHTLEIASVDANGVASNLDAVQVTLYKINWKWWWDKSSDSLSSYSNANHSSKLQQSIVKTSNGRGQWKFKINYPDWGRYLIRACDVSGKHCTGKTLYMDWPGWAGRAQEEGSSAASTLSLTTDKKEYKVGETAIIQAPKATQGRALLTVESSNEILQQQWIIFDKTRQQVSLPITAKMAPNVYANITVLQPHNNRKSDRPIRMIGIVPLKVLDPKTHLTPVITAKDEWKPKSKQTVHIKEANNKTMTYTLALVDEGLLGLTRFRTPNLHQYFYRKEALGIKSWDLFDQVVGAYGGNIERILALGGGDDVQLDDAANKPKRFPPIVQFFGPFTLKAGESKQHELELPPYIGAVRLMVVAGDQGSYGLTEKSIFVRDPLIIQPSLPRILSSNEEMNIPITVFSTRDDIKDVEITIVTDDLISTESDKTTVHFDKVGDKLGFIRIKTGSKTGKSKLTITATSGQYQSSSEIFIDIRHPNPLTHTIADYTVNAQSASDLTIKSHGLAGTNTFNLEVSTIPPLGLHKHLDYLIKYPHGCLEQTTSAAFPQLYLSQLVDGSAAKAKETENNVAAAIDKLKTFQNMKGDFSYWPGGNRQNLWASLYAGHFLVEAKKQGFEVNDNMLNSWLTYQVKQANNWLQGNKNYAYIQAYRLYVLALAGKPEIGAMNRLKESNQRGYKSRWLLAAAYKLSGLDTAAKSVVEGLIANPEIATEKNSDTFSSNLSDLGIVLNALSTLENNADAKHYIKAIAKELSKEHQNTHGIAWALAAVSHHVGGKEGSGVKTTLTRDGKNPEVINSKKSFISRQYTGIAKEDLKVKLDNPSAKMLYTQLTSSGIPASGDESEVQNGMKLTIEYFDVNSKEKLDMSQPITQGQDILVTITMSQDYQDRAENLALTYIVATGMEIHNPNVGNNKALDHQNVRDDRIHSYFALNRETPIKLSFIVNAAYAGKAYLPAVQVQSMYQPEKKARIKGQWVHVARDAGTKAKAPVSAKSTINAVAVIDIKKAKVIPRKAWLYNEPNDEGKSKMYLIKNDRVEILKELSSEEKGQWSFIRFYGSKTVEMWLKTEHLAK